MMSVFNRFRYEFELELYFFLCYIDNFCMKCLFLFIFDF
jgi:hypothetical protein